MKKLIVSVVTATMMFSSVAMASDADYEARIAELEHRVAVIEEKLGITSDVETQIEESIPAATNTVSLGIGTWIVGEDIPAGKYNLTSPDGTAYVKIYKSYDDRISDEHSFIESYNVTSQAYIDALLEASGGENAELYSSLYHPSASNIRLEDGFCLYIEDATADFTPAQ
jgi:hypothetical protein